MAELRFHDVDNRDVSRLIDILAGYKVDIILTPETLTFEELDESPTDYYLIDGRPYFFLDIVEEEDGTFFVFEDDHGSLFFIEDHAVDNYHIVGREDIRNEDFRTSW